LHKKAIVIVIIPIIIAALAAVGVYIYLTDIHTTGFLRGTALNGEDISGKTVDEVVSVEKEWMESLKVQLVENDKTALEGSMSDFGYTFNESSFRQTLQDLDDKQKSDFLVMVKTFFAGSKLTIDDDYTFDSAVNKKFAVSASFAEPRVKSEDASLKINKKTDLYEVAEAVQGNEIDDDKLQSYVNSKIKEALNGRTLSKSDTLKIDVPSDVYSSKKVSNDTTALAAQIDEKNKEHREEEFKDMNITYTFGSATEVLSGDTISQWVTVSDDLKVTLDEDKLKEYVANLASKYNTRYLGRSFKTTGGKTIKISAAKNEYGYTINQDSEIKQLKKDILAMKSVSREPIYYSTNSYNNPNYYSRNGTDDLNGTYVEISLTDQHLWFYVGGKLIVESDIVSGCVDNGTETATGCYPLAYKKSPATLTGQNAEDEWSSDVDYWMPFYSGEGLHDAPWRSAFGGSIYVSDGSHGCVNLPHSVAKKIYNNIVPGMAIIIYK